MYDGVRERPGERDRYAAGGRVEAIGRGFGRGVWTAIVGIVLMTVAFLGVIPALALISTYDVATKSAIVQASVSWWGAILALAASAVALLAYRNSMQRPDLDLGAVNSLDVVALTLTNVGSATARYPVVRVHFTAPYEFDPEYLGVEWRREDFTADGLYRTISWYGEGAVVHPGFEFHLPAIAFKADVTGDTRVFARITWACEGRLAKVKPYAFWFPSPR